MDGKPDLFGDFDYFVSDPFRPEDLERAYKALSDQVERRDFLKKAGRVVGGLALAASLGSLASCARKEGTAMRPGTAPSTIPASPAAGPGPADLGIAMGQDAATLTRKAVDAIGGMGRFVKPGNLVVIKPNASFFGGIETATSTHPEVVASVVTMCSEAGAKRVIVMDHTLRGAAQACLSSNGIGAAVSRSGGELLAYGAGDTGHGVDAQIPNATVMRRANVYPEVLNADVVITVPKAKHHGSAGLSLGMKNFIGVVTNMSSVHTSDLHRAIADLNTLVRPDLSVIDATIILLGNGPGGPGPTRAAGTVIASSDVVAADSYASTLFGKTAADVPYILYGQQAGLGQADLNKLRIARV
jgi:uncharacterized protein (DUF362 family)